MENNMKIETITRYTPHQAAQKAIDALKHQLNKVTLLVEGTYLS